MSIESLNAFSMDFFSLKGKTAIVTGGNSGLGQAFAMALAKAGANIFIPSFVKDNGETKEMIENNSLWLKEEPSKEMIIEEFKKYNLNDFMHRIS